MKDLTNYSTIANNQEKDCTINALFFINGINKTSSKNFITTLYSLAIGTDTNIFVNGNYAGYTGYIIIKNEVMIVSSSTWDGTKTTMAVTRQALGTVKETSYAIGTTIYPVDLFKRLANYKYSQQSDGSESDLFGVNMDTGSVVIYDEPIKWSKFNASKEYNYKNRKKVFLFEGINGQYIKRFEGLTYRKTNNNVKKSITIDFKSDLSKFWEENITQTKVYYNNTIKEVLEDLFTGYTVSYINNTNESDYIKLTNFKTSKYSTYGDLLNGISKLTLTRIRFTEDNRILVTSDLVQSNISPTVTLNKKILDIDDSDSSQIVFNKVSSTYYEKKENYNVEDFKDGSVLRRVYFSKSKNYTTLTNFITNNIFQTLTLTGVETSYIQIGDYVLIVDDASPLEFWGMATNISQTSVDVVLGMDKDYLWYNRGRIDNITNNTGSITLSSFTLYYGKRELPIVWRYARSIGDEDRDSNLQYPICPPIISTSYTLVAEISSSQTIFDIVGNINNYNKYILIESEWMKVESAIYNSGTGNTTLVVDRGQFNTTPVIHLVGTSVYKLELLDIEEIYGSFSFSNVGDKEYAGIVGRIENIWGWHSNSHLYYNRLYRQSQIDIPIYAMTNKISNTTNDSNQVIKYTSFNNADINIGIERASDNNNDFKMTILNSMTPILFSSLTSYTPITVNSSVLEVSSTIYNSAKAGNILILSPVTDITDDRYGIYTTEKNTKWTVQGKFEADSKYYIYLNMPYPPLTSDGNYDFYMIDNSKIIHLNELSIRGNPIMQIKQEFSETNYDSVEVYGTNEFNIEAESYSDIDFKKVVDYLKNTYAGIDTTNTRYRFKIELPTRLDLEVGDAVYLTDSLYYGITNLKCLITAIDVSSNDAKRTSKYTLISIGDYTVNPNNITYKSTLNYSNVVIPQYTHTGREGTTQQMVVDDGKIVSLTDSITGELISFKEVSTTTFTASVSITNSIPSTDKSSIINLSNVTATDSYKSILLRENVVGYLKLNGEYIEYKSIGTGFNSIQIQRRGVFDTSPMTIQNGDLITFMQIIFKTTENGLYATEASLGNGTDAIIEIVDDKINIASKGVVDISNINNRMYFDPNSDGDNSFIALNKATNYYSAQIGKVTENSTGTEITYNGVFFGNPEDGSTEYLKYTSQGLIYEGKYFNKVAYCRDGLDFIGALDTSIAIITISSVNYDNPFYNLEVNKIVLSEQSTIYSLIGLNNNHFGTQGYIVPSSSINEITSPFGTSISYVNCLNWGFLLNYPIKINNIQFRNLGSAYSISSIHYAIMIESDNVSISNTVFKEISYPISRGVGISNMYLDTIKIDGVDENTLEIGSIKAIFYLLSGLNNITIVLQDIFTDASTYYFKSCSNISNIRLLGADGGGAYSCKIFNSCTNVNNMQAGIFNPKVLFNQCYLINNIDMGLYEDITGNSEYLFEESGLISNVNISGTTYCNKYFYNCSYLNNIRATTNSAENSGLTKVDTNTVSW